MGLATQINGILTTVKGQYETISNICHLHSMDSLILFPWHIFDAMIASGRAAEATWIHIRLLTTLTITQVDSIGLQDLRSLHAHRLSLTLFLHNLYSSSLELILFPLYTPDYSQAFFPGGS